MDDEEFTKVLGGGGSGFPDVYLHLPTLQLVYDSLKDLPGKRLKMNAFPWQSDLYWFDCIDKEKLKPLQAYRENPYKIADDDIQEYTMWRITVVNAGAGTDNGYRWKHLMEWLKRRIEMNVSNGKNS